MNCPERYHVFQIGETEFAWCHIIDRIAWHDKGHNGFPESVCIQCQKAGAPENNPYLCEFMKLLLKDQLSYLHLDDKPWKKKGVVHKDALDRLKDLNESNQNMRCYLYWLYSHQLISEEEFGTLTNLYNLNEDIGSPDGEQADAIRRFSHRDRI